MTKSLRLTKKWIKLLRFCPTNQAVDFILKYTTKNRRDNTGGAISAKKEGREASVNLRAYNSDINECIHQILHVGNFEDASALKETSCT